MRTKDFWNYVAADSGDSPEYTVTVYIGPHIMTGIVRVRGYGPSGADELYRSFWLTVDHRDVLIAIASVDFIHKGEPLSLASA